MRKQISSVLCALAVTGACVDAEVLQPPPESSPPESSDPPALGEVEVAKIKTTEGIRTIGFRRNNDGTVVFDGDIMLFEHDLEAARVDRSTRSAISTADGRWPNGIIPFRIDPDLPNPQRVTDAIAHWEANTPFRFVAATDFSSSIVFVPSDVCESHVGRSSLNLPQSIKLADLCGVPETIHEIGHAIGMFHEQTRHDRDTHVEIVWHCIKDGEDDNFEMYDSSDGDDVGPYDHSSIMHYGRNDFSIADEPGDEPCPTINVLDPHAPPIRAGAGLSAGDVLGAHRIFSGTRPKVRAVPADYDGDGRADLAIKDDAGAWRIDFAINGFGAWDQIHTSYGGATAIPVPADYDGDHKADLAVKSNSDRTWYIDYSSDGFHGWNVIRAGVGDAVGVPAPADYDGDGRADIGVKNSSGVWFVDLAANGFGNTSFDIIRSGYGNAASVPVPADYDGDGKADFSVKDVSGTWFVDFAKSPQDGWNLIRNGYGDATAIPVPADYDGDGKADFSVKNAIGQWLIDFAASPQDGWNVILNGYGGSDSVPVPANYDGVDADGKRRADPSVKVIGHAGEWFVDQARNGFGGWDIFKVLGV